VADSEAHAGLAGRSDERGFAKAHPADERLEVREFDRRAMASPMPRGHEQNGLRSGILNFETPFESSRKFNHKSD
jgi:hypothetical protein